MELFASTFLRGLLGLASVLILLAVLVQIIQELYKFLTNSKSRAYMKALIDFIGPWAYQLIRSDLLPNLLARGPFQIRRLKPKGVLLPLDKQQLVSRLESTAPSWIQKTLKVLNQEVRHQEGIMKEPTPTWQEFIQELGTVERGDIGYWNAFEVSQWLKTWGHGLDITKDSNEIGSIYPPSTFSANELLYSFRQKFLSHIQDAEDYFPQLENNFEYTYRRRNLRLTFTFALLISLLFNFSAERIYLKATMLSAEESVALAENSIRLYESFETEEIIDSATMKQKVEKAKKILDTSLESLSETENSQKYFVTWDDIKTLSDKPIWALIRYLFGCLITAILVSFGAPFWNDIAKSLLKIQQGRKQKTD